MVPAVTHERGKDVTNAHTPKQTSKNEYIHTPTTQTQRHIHTKGLYPPPVPSYLFSMQSLSRTEETEKNLFHLHVIASELVGGMRESKKRGRRKSERCRKGADSSLFENSLNGTAPK